MSSKEEMIKINFNGLASNFKRRSVGSRFIKATVKCKFFGLLGLIEKMLSTCDKFFSAPFSFWVNFSHADFNCDVKCDERTLRQEIRFKIREIEFFRN